MLAKSENLILEPNLTIDFSTWCFANMSAQCWKLKTNLIIPCDTANAIAGVCVLKLEGVM